MAFHNVMNENRILSGHVVNKNLIRTCCKYVFEYAPENGMDDGGFAREFFWVAWFVF